MQDLPARSVPMPRLRPAAPCATTTGTTTGTATQLRIDVTLDGSRCTVRLDGELDLITVAQLRGVLRRVCEGGHQLVIVDLAELRFIGLAGLHALVDAQQTLQAGGCRLVLSHPGALTMRVLAITGLDRLLHLVPEHEQSGSEVAPEPGASR